MNRSGADHRPGSMKFTLHAHPDGAFVLNQDLLHRRFQFDRIGEFRGELLAQSADAAFGIDVPNLGVFRQFAAVPTADGSAG